MPYTKGDPVNFPLGLQPAEDRKLAAGPKSTATVDNPLPLAPPTYEESIEALEYDPETNKGSVGWAVYSIQSGLISNGRNLVADGLFGPLTRKHVLSFQENNGLYVDGIVGPATKRKLVDKLATRVDQADPSLPDNLIRELCRAEGGDNPAAINPYDPPNSTPGTDCGISQIRLTEPYTMDGLKQAFSPYDAMLYSARRFNEAKTKFMTYGWTRNNRVRAEHCALMSHNWPVAANDIAFDGRLYNPDGEAAWVPDGVKMLDGTLVNTRLEWVQFYSGLLGGDPPHCGTLVSRVKFGQ